MSGKSHSALMSAVKNGDADQLTKLINEGASVRRIVALHHVVASGNAEIARILVDNGAAVLQRDSNGNTALHLAVARNDIGMVEVLLKSASRSGKLRELMDTRTTAAGNTALHLASQLRIANSTCKLLPMMDGSSYAMAVLLLAYGARFDARNASGMLPHDLTPGINIAHASLLKMIELQFKIVGMGAKMDTAGMGEYVCATNCRDSRGFTLLQAAMQVGRKDAIESIVQLRSAKSSGFLAKDDQLELLDKLAALVGGRVAALNGRLKKLLEGSVDALRITEEALDDAREIASAVRSYEQQIDLESVGNLDARSIQEAVEYLDDEYLKMTRGDPKALAQLLMLAVYQPAQFVEESICEALLIDAVMRGDLQKLERCFDENPKMSKKLTDSIGRSNGEHTPLPFHTSTFLMQPGVIEPLLKNCVMKRTHKTYMALHLAAKNNHLDIIKCLLKRGAVYCAQVYGGKTPEELASDEDVVGFFKTIAKLFTLAKEGNSVEFLSELKKLKGGIDLSAVANARDEDGCTLIDVAEKHEDIAEDFMQILKEAEQF